MTNRAAQKLELDVFENTNTEDAIRFEDLINNTELTKKEITELGKLVRKIFNSDDFDSFKNIFSSEEQKAVLREEIVSTLNDIKPRLANGTFMLEN